MAWTSLSLAECFEQRTSSPCLSGSESVTGGFGQADRKAPLGLTFCDSGTSRAETGQTPDPRFQPCSPWCQSMGRAGRRAVWL